MILLHFLLTFLFTYSKKGIMSSPIQYIYEIIPSQTSLCLNGLYISSIHFYKVYTTQVQIDRFYIIWMKTKCSLYALADLCASLKPDMGADTRTQAKRSLMWVGGKKTRLPVILVGLKHLYCCQSFQSQMSIGRQFY